MKSFTMLSKNFITSVGPKNHEELQTTNIAGLVNVYQKTDGKDPPFFMGKLTISMVISHSYVSLPEGRFLF
jgi:hypothetical protein